MVEETDGTREPRVEVKGTVRDPTSLHSLHHLTRLIPATLLSPLDLGCECKVREVTSEPGTSIRRAEVIGAGREWERNERPDMSERWWRWKETGWIR